jgi:hypothetical protein
MNLRKLAYSLAVIVVSYDVLSTFIAAKLYGRFADLSLLYNFLYQGNPVYIPITILITLCDFAAVYLLIFESIAVPHNTMVLFGSYGIVLSSEMFIIQEIVSALIAGVIVGMVDWKRIY